MRIFSLLVLCLSVSACNKPETANRTALEIAEAEAAGAAAEDGRIACAVSGATQFSRTCQLEQGQSEVGLILTVRHPDGGFRRLQVVKDGRGVIAADGADTAVVTLVGAGEIEVALSGDRYRLPATIKPAVK